MLGHSCDGIIQYGLALFLLWWKKWVIHQNIYYHLMRVSTKSTKKNKLIFLWGIETHKKCMNSDIKGGSNLEQILDTFLNGTKSPNAKNMYKFQQMLFSHKNKVSMSFHFFSNIGMCGLHIRVSHSGGGHGGGHPTPPIQQFFLNPVPSPWKWTPPPPPTHTHTHTPEAPFHEMIAIKSTINNNS